MRLGHAGRSPLVQGRFPFPTRGSIGEVPARHSPALHLPGEPSVLPGGLPLTSLDNLSLIERGGRTSGTCEPFIRATLS